MCQSKSPVQEAQSAPAGWLKYTPVFKHGLGEPGYVELSADGLSGDLLDDVKHGIREEHGDPEGLRDCRWEVVIGPPLEVLEKMLADTASEHKWAEQRMSRYKAAIDARESPPAGEGNAIELLRRAMDSAGLPDEFRAPMIGYFCNELNAAPQEGGEK